MFEKQLSSLLVAHLQHFIANLNEDNLNVSLWSGSLVLHDLELQPTILQEITKLLLESEVDIDEDKPPPGQDSLLIPLTVAKGVISELVLTIPWSTLDQEPVSVEVKGLHIVLKPLRASPFDSSEEDARSEVLRQAQLNRFERRVSSLFSSQYVTQASKIASPVTPLSYFHNFISTILRNVHVAMTNIHLAYEFDYQGLHPSLAAAVAVQLDKVYMTTTDESFRDRFVYDLSIPLYKKVDFSEITVNLYAGKNPIGKLDVESDSKLSSATFERQWNHQAVLAKTDSLTVNLAMGEADEGNSVPFRRIIFSFCSGTTVCASFGSIASLWHLYESLIDGIHHAKWRKFLPLLDSNETTALRRWKFAYSCVVEQLKLSKKQSVRESLGQTESELRNCVSFGQVRRQYCELYKRFLKVPWLLPLRAQEQIEKKNIEKNLSLEQILFLRCLSRAEISNDETAIKLQQSYVKAAKNRQDFGKKSRMRKFFGWLRSEELDVQEVSGSGPSVEVDRACVPEFIELVHQNWNEARHVLGSTAGNASLRSTSASTSFRGTTDIEVELISLTMIFSPQYWDAVGSTLSKARKGFLQKVGQELVLRLGRLRGTVHSVATPTEKATRWNLSLGSFRSEFCGMFSSLFLESKRYQKKTDNFITAGSSSKTTIEIFPSHIVLRPLHELVWWSHEMRRGVLFLSSLVDNKVDGIGSTRKVDSSHRNCSSSSSIPLTLELHPMEVIIPLFNDDFTETSSLGHLNVSTPVGSLSCVTSSTDIHSVLSFEESEGRGEVKKEQSESFCTESDVGVRVRNVVHGPRLIARIPFVSIETTPQVQADNNPGEPEVTVSVRILDDISVSCQIERDEEGKKNNFVHIEFLQVTSLSATLNSRKVAVHAGFIHGSLEPTVLALLNDTIFKAMTPSDCYTVSSLTSQKLQEDDWRLNRPSELVGVSDSSAVTWSVEKSRDYISFLCHRYYSSDSSARDTSEGKSGSNSTEVYLTLNFFHGEILNLQGNRVAEVEALPHEVGLPQFGRNQEGVPLLRAVSFHSTDCTTVEISHLCINNDAGKSLVEMEGFQWNAHGCAQSVSIGSLTVGLDPAVPEVLHVLLESAASVTFFPVEETEQATSFKSPNSSNFSVCMKRASIKLPLSAGVDGVAHAYLVGDFQECQVHTERAGIAEKFIATCVVHQILKVEDNGLSANEFVVLSKSQEFVGASRFPTFSVTKEISKDGMSTVPLNFSLAGGQISLYFPFIFEMISLSSDTFYVSLFSTVSESSTSPGFTVRGAAWKDRLKEMMPSNKGERCGYVTQYEGTISDIELFIAADAFQPINTSHEDTYFFMYLRKLALFSQSEHSFETGDVSILTKARANELFYFPFSQPTTLEVFSHEINYVYQYTEADGKSTVTTKTEFMKPKKSPLNFSISVQQLCVLSGVLYNNWFVSIPPASSSKPVDHFSAESLLPAFQLTVDNGSSAFQFYWKDGIHYFFEGAVATSTFQNFELSDVRVELAKAYCNALNVEQKAHAVNETKRQHINLGRVLSVTLTMHYLLPPYSRIDQLPPSKWVINGVTMLFHSSSWAQLAIIQRAVATFQVLAMKRREKQHRFVNSLASSNSFPLGENESLAASLQVDCSDFIASFFEPWDPKPLFTLNMPWITSHANYEHDVLKEGELALSQVSFCATKKVNVNHSEDKKDICTFKSVKLKRAYVTEAEEAQEKNIRLEPIAVAAELQSLTINADVDFYNRVVAYLYSEVIPIVDAKDTIASALDSFTANDSSVYASTIPCELCVRLRDVNVFLPYEIGEFSLGQLQLVHTKVVQKRVVSEVLLESTPSINANGNGGLFGLPSDRFYAPCLVPEVLLEKMKVILPEGNVFLLPDITVAMSIPIKDAITTSELDSTGAPLRKWRYVPLSYLRSAKVQLLYESVFNLKMGNSMRFSESLIRSLYLAHLRLSGMSFAPLPPYYNSPEMNQEEAEEVDLLRKLSVKVVVSPFEWALCSISKEGNPSRVASFRAHDQVKLSLNASSRQDMAVRIALNGKFEVTNENNCSIIYGSSSDTEPVVVEITIMKDSVFITTTVDGISFDCNSQAVDLAVKLQCFYTRVVNVITPSTASMSAASGAASSSVKKTFFTTKIRKILWNIEDIAELELGQAEIKLIWTGSTPVYESSNEGDGLYVLRVSDISLRSNKTKDIFAKIISGEIRVGVGNVAVRIQQLNISHVDMYYSIVQRVSSLLKYFYRTVQFPKNIEKRFENKVIVSVLSMEIIMWSTRYGESSPSSDRIALRFPALVLNGVLTNTSGKYSVDSENGSAHYIGEGVDQFSLIENFFFSLQYEEDSMRRMHSLSLRFRKISVRIPVGSPLSSCLSCFLSVSYSLVQERAFQSISPTDVFENSISICNEEQLSRVMEISSASNWLGSRFSVYIPLLDIRLCQSSKAVNEPLASLQVKNVSFEWNINPTSNVALVEMHSVSSAVAESVSTQGPFIVVTGTSKAVDPQSKVGLYSRYEKLLVAEAKRLDDALIPSEKISTSVRLNNAVVTISPELINFLNHEVLYPLATAVRNAGHEKTSCQSVRLSTANEAKIQSSPCSKILFEQNAVVIYSDLCISSNLVIGGSTGIVFHFRKNQNLKFPKNVINLSSAEGVIISVEPIRLSNGRYAPSIIVEEGLTVHVSTPLVLASCSLQDVVLLQDRAIFNISDKYLSVATARVEDTHACLTADRTSGRVFQQVDVDFQGDCSLVIWSKNDKIKLSLKMIVSYHLEKIFCELDPFVSDYLDEFGTVDLREIAVISNSAAMTEKHFSASINIQHQKKGEESGVSVAKADLPQVAFFISFNQIQLSLKLMKELENSGKHLWKTLGSSEGQQQRSFLKHRLSSISPASANTRFSLLELELSAPLISFTLINDLSVPLLDLSLQDTNGVVKGNRNLSSLLCEMRTAVLVQDYPSYSSTRTILTMSPELVVDYSWYPNSSSSMAVALTCSQIVVTLPMLSLVRVAQQNLLSNFQGGSYGLRNELGIPVTILMPSDSNKISVVPSGAVANLHWSTGNFPAFYVLLHDRHSLAEENPEEAKRIGQCVEAASLQNGGIHRIPLFHCSFGSLDTVLRLESDRLIRLTTSVMVENGFLSHTLQLSDGSIRKPGGKGYATLEALSLPLNVKVGHYTVVVDPTEKVSLETIISSYFLCQEDDNYPNRVSSRLRGMCSQIEPNNLQMLLPLAIAADHEGKKDEADQNLSLSLIVKTTYAGGVTECFPGVLPNFEVSVLFTAVHKIMNCTGCLLLVSTAESQFRNEADVHEIKHMKSVDFLCTSSNQRIFFRLDRANDRDVAYLDGSIEFSEAPLHTHMLVKLTPEVSSCEMAVIVEHTEVGVIVIRSVAILQNNLPCCVAITLSKGAKCTDVVKIHPFSQVPLLAPYNSVDPNSVEEPVYMRIACCPSKEVHSPLEWSEPYICNAPVPPTTLFTKGVTSFQVLLLSNRVFENGCPSLIEFVPKWCFTNILSTPLEVKFLSDPTAELKPKQVAYKETVNFLECPSLCASDPEIQIRLLLDGVECVWSAPIKVGSLCTVGASLHWKYRLPDISSLNFPLPYFELCRVPTHPSASMEKEWFIDLCLTTTAENTQNHITVSSNSMLPLLIENRTGKELQIRELPLPISKTFSTISPSTWGYFVPAHCDVRMAFDVLSLHPSPLRIDVLGENSSTVLKNLAELAVAEEMNKIGTRFFALVTVKTDSQCYVVTVTENRHLDRRAFSPPHFVAHIDVLVKNLSVYFASAWAQENNIEEAGRKHFVSLARKGGLRLTDSDSDMLPDREIIHLLSQREMDLFLLRIVGLYAMASYNDKHCVGNISVGRVEVVDCTTPKPVYPILLDITNVQLDELAAEGNVASGGPLIARAPCLSVMYHLTSPKAVSEVNEGKKRRVVKVVVKKFDMSIAGINLRLHDAFLYTLRSAIERGMQEIHIQELFKESKVSEFHAPSVLYDLGFQDFFISSVSLKLTIKRRVDSGLDPFKNLLGGGSMFTIPSVEGAPLMFSSIQFRGCHLRGPHPLSLVGATICSFYRTQMYVQVYKVIGSLELLGNPVALLAGWGRGVRSLIVSTAALDPVGGAQGFLRETTSSTLHSVGLLSHLGSQIAAKLSFDEEWAQRSHERSVSKKGSMMKGIAQGLAQGVVDGVEGVFHKPIIGARNGGVPGFLTGVAGGVAGLVSRPLSGVLRTVGDTAQFFSVLLDEPLSPGTSLQAYLCCNRNFRNPAEAQSNSHHRSNVEMTTILQSGKYLTQSGYERLVKREFLGGREIATSNVKAVIDYVGIHNVVAHTPLEKLMECLTKEQLYEWADVIVVGSCARYLAEFRQLCDSPSALLAIRASMKKAAKGQDCTSAAEESNEKHIATILSVKDLKQMTTQPKEFKEELIEDLVKAAVVSYAHLLYGMLVRNLQSPEVSISTDTK